MAETARRTALICPGQGAQKPGGVASLPGIARAVFDRGSALAGIDLWEAGRDWPAERLAMPSVLQPLLVVWAVAELERARAEQADFPHIDMVLGHSSGQNSAMVLAGAVDFASAVQFAHTRGEHLDAGCQAERSGLLALAGLDRTAAATLAKAAGAQVANYNGEDQVVLGGRLPVLERASALAEAQGIRAVLLRVAGAFHTAIFREADARTESSIAALTVAMPFTPLIGNAHGQWIRDATGLRAELSGQYTRPIEWVAALQTAYDAGVRRFVLTGPGNAMNGLLRRFVKTREGEIQIVRLNHAA